MNGLPDTLARLNQALSEFIKLLEEESTALAAQDTERLTALLPRRDDANRALSGLWLGLAELAGSKTPAGLASLREMLFGNAPPPEAWRRLEQLAHAADHLNRVNGRMIDEQMRRTQAAMQVLQNTASSRGLYGADGRVASLFQTNRTIDSA